ncbi:hypothetical protein G6F46_003760 [Rhizopus delemar]|uniref:[histone H3]-lysine(36) N-trimethyltransferase n=3 Tax=Rhizopus TaxID=4842 RepID=I1CM29_RHIO9|nr:hypothetical protein RO3G_14220 [Rhizopus delemar RA 99-880]KAG1459510.1 hypothetical protein G6F55_004718 [Rhizopus delemar]KAG1547934.1 hypothetical protein G6F51_003964 [Rhizopus arrhizus]KAG1504934.1 hypothetical protein G6F54_000663 [Rhizopus delemar]KAG1514831.1 hypothetical protein G6F53_003375 [Rhizopus delemar]|eukprot:EIE89509.1 hypothetical protein RO3G_14220 [Rhizopus delemar RA 99-880]
MNLKPNPDSAEAFHFLSNSYNILSNSSQSEVELAPFGGLSLDSSVTEAHRSFKLEDDDKNSSRFDKQVNEEQLEEEHQLPSATADAMETYVNLIENVYCGSATGKTIAEESMPCECKYLQEVDDLDAACGDDNYCINRMMFMECTAEDCPCGRYCRNRRFQLRQFARVDVIRTEKKGFGLRALTDLPTNSFIMEYIGEVIPNQEFIRRTKEYEASGLEHYYFMTLKTDEIIDATKKGCLARFINHSCNPNCVTQKWVVGKNMRIGIFTNRGIKAGEELTFDYKFERYGAQAQVCYCGEFACKGFIGGSFKNSDSPRTKTVSSKILTNTDDEEDDDDDNNDRKQSDSDIEEVVTLTQKRMLQKMKRRKETQPLQHPDEVKSFVKKMLDSVGKSRLVIKLLHRLELIDKDTTLGKEIFRKFIHLHGLKMLKFWLGEWKNDKEILIRVFHVLSQLPLTNRNGLEDCKMFEIVGKFIHNKDEQINTSAKDLLSNWEPLKSIYRIPKRHTTELTRSLNNKSSVGESANNEDAHSFVRFDSSREFFDPDNDYFEYFSVNTDTSEIQWKLEFPPRCVIPTAPRAMVDSKNSYHGYLKNSTILATSYIPYSTTHNIDRMSSHSNVSYNPHYRSKSGDSFIQLNDNHSIDSTSTTSPLKKLPSNWKFAYADNGIIYYYHQITGKTQWNFPEEKCSLIEGANQKDLEDLVEKATQDVDSKKSYIKSDGSSISPVNHANAKPSHHITPVASKKRTLETGDTLSGTELKKAIGKIVTKYLSSKSKDLWNNDKYLFKEIARKITHHIVDRETQSSRKIQSINSSVRSKIEKFIDSHATELVSKIIHKRKQHPVIPNVTHQLLVRSPRSTTSEDTNKYFKGAFSPSVSPPPGNVTATTLENEFQLQYEGNGLPPTKKRMSLKIDAFSNYLPASHQSLASLEKATKNSQIDTMNNTASNDEGFIKPSLMENNSDPYY